MEEKKLSKINIIGIIITVVVILILIIWGGVLVSRFVLNNNGNNNTNNNVNNVVTNNTANNTNNTNKNEVINVEFHNMQEDDVSYMWVCGRNKDGLPIWDYFTKETSINFLSAEKIGVVKDRVIINEYGTIVALDKQTGKKVWTNDEYLGTNSTVKFDDDGNIYLSNSSNSSVFIVDINGNTISK